MTCFFLFGEQQLNAMQCSELHNEQGMRRERNKGERKRERKGREREERERGRDDMEGRWRKRGEKGTKGG